MNLGVYSYHDTHTVHISHISWHLSVPWHTCGQKTSITIRKTQYYLHTGLLGKKNHRHIHPLDLLQGTVIWKIQVVNLSLTQFPWLALLKGLSGALDLFGWLKYRATGQTAVKFRD